MQHFMKLPTGMGNSRHSNILIMNIHSRIFMHGDSDNRTVVVHLCSPATGKIMSTFSPFHMFLWLRFTTAQLSESKNSCSTLISQSCCPARKVFLELWVLSEKKKKKSVFKDYQWCKKIEIWRKKLLPCERGHSGSSVIKGNAALNTRHWILLSKFKPYHIAFSFAQQHSKFIKIFSWESLIASFSFTQFFLPVCFSKTSMVILGLIIGPHLLGPFSLNKIQLGMPAGPSCKGKLTTPMRVLHDMFIARPCTINCMD